MWPATDVVHDRRVVEHRVHIVIDAAVDGPAVTGVVTSDRTAPRSFTGRLGLVTAIDRALTAGQEAAPPKETTP